MIKRDITAELRRSFREFPVVTVLGPRQSGKTTLVRMAFPEVPYASLEDPDSRSFAESDPRGFLGEMPDGGILDEIQRVPELLSYLQTIVDERAGTGRFILTGSHQPRLHEAISQSLAGRTAILALWPFSLHELARYERDDRPFDLLVRGFYPRVHDHEVDPRRFYNGYVQTYVERDVRALIQLRDLYQFQQFLTLLAGRVGHVVNYASLSNDLGISATTIKNWISVLKASYVVFELPPYFQRMSRRVIKSPKIYFVDVGLAAFLLGIRTEEQAARDPLRGNLYENLVIADVVKCAQNRGIRPDLHFFRDARGNEVDLLVQDAGRLTPVEIKSGETFSSAFVTGIERFREAVRGDTESGFVYFNGAQHRTYRGVRVRNPLKVGDTWAAVTGS